MQVEIQLHASDVRAYPLYGAKMHVEIEGVDVGEIVKTFGVERLLDQIGEQACRDHFQIEED